MNILLQILEKKCMFLYGNICIIKYFVYELNFMNIDLLKQWILSFRTKKSVE